MLAAALNAGTQKNQSHARQHDSATKQTEFRKELQRVIVRMANKMRA